MKRVYIAGPYSSDTIKGVLDNIHNGIKKAVEILKQGYAPFCPFLDYQFHFFDKDLTVDDYYNYSMAWLEVADELWVLPNFENSVGTLKEIQRAKELNIPVKYI